MKIHKFFHCGFAQADMKIGFSEGLYPGKEDMTVVSLENQGCFNASVRLRDARGKWHNFGSVEGFELAFYGSDERDALIKLMKNLIEQDEANKSGAEVERQRSDEHGPFYSGLYYDGMEEEADRVIQDRFWRPDAYLYEDEE